MPSGTAPFLAGALFLASAVGTEALAYLIHRHVMHGPLWILHRSHHRARHGGIEANDAFHVVFALPSVALIYFGLRGFPLLLPLGLGMAAYGIANWAFHDVLVHRRIPHRWVPRSRYLRRIVHAHHVHHRTRTRDGAESFGFFVAPDYRARTARG
jgi:beta-carotene 3-hydroxylase